MFHYIARSLTVSQNRNSAGLAEQLAPYLVPALGAMAAVAGVFLVLRMLARRDMLSVQPLIDALARLVSLPATMLESWQQHRQQIRGKRLDHELETERRRLLHQLEREKADGIDPPPDDPSPPGSDGTVIHLAEFRRRKRTCDDEDHDPKPA